MVLQKMKFLSEFFSISSPRKDIVEDLLHEEPYFFLSKRVGTNFSTPFKSNFSGASG